MAQRPPSVRLPVEKPSARAVKSANSLNRTITLIAVCADSCFSLQLGSDSGMGVTHPTGYAEPATGQRRPLRRGSGTARPACQNACPVLGRGSLTTTWVSVSRYGALGLQMCSVYIIQLNVQKKKESYLIV